jgi:hypothetical protein
MTQPQPAHDCPICAEARAELDRVRSTFALLRMGHGDQNALARLGRRAEELQLQLYGHETASTSKQV